MNEAHEERVALKDERLVYRACSLNFARSIGFDSPDQIIGLTDFDLFSGETAREQMALDSQTLFTGQADISTMTISRQDGELEPRQLMVVRTPLLDDKDRVRGIDIRLLGGSSVTVPKAVITIDYQTLVNEGIQGSLIVSKDTILFANERAASVLGYPSAQHLVDQGRVTDIFATQNLMLAESDGSLGRQSAELPATVHLKAMRKNSGPIEIVCRIIDVQWGASRATLMSFVDVSALRDQYQAAFSSTALTIPQQLELKRARASEARFRHYVKSASDFFWEMDSSWTFRIVSDGLCQALGIPREHLLSRTHSQLLAHPANINSEVHWQEHIDALHAHQPFRDFEFRWSVEGDVRVIRYSGLPVFSRKREFLGYRGVGCDVTAAVKHAETTAYHAKHDALTGLVNRRYFETALSKALDLSRDKRVVHALCFMDLDEFKIVNDTAGHQAGDELLRQITQLFDSLIRKSDVLARLGGDEFGVLLFKCSVAEALKLANQIRHEVENFQFLWKDTSFSVGVSIGLVIVDDRWESIESLFNAADSACYIAKNEGRNRVVVYREAEGNSSNRKVATHWVEVINSALESDRIRLAQQKIMPLALQPEGERYEVFLRIETENGQCITPTAFLPAAERYGLVAELDKRAIRLTLDWLTENPKLLAKLRHVSINLSAASFTDESFKTSLIDLITASGVPAEKLCFEIAETTAIANLSKLSRFMDDLSAVGCRFGIDEFGSGLTSFTYLRKLPVDFLKIDGLIIKDILNDITSHTIVKAINEISHSMGKRTVAEHIESAETLSAIEKLGIDFCQGHFLAEPELIHVASNTSPIETDRAEIG